MRFEHQYGEGSTKTIMELDKDVTVSEAIDDFFKFLVGIGYQQESIDSYIEQLQYERGLEVITLDSVAADELDAYLNREDFLC